jgi:hypothetical protein
MERQNGPVANCEVRIGDTNAFPFANSNRSHGLDQVAQVKILEANQQIQFDWSGNNNNYRAYNNENQQHETQTVPITGKPHITEKSVFLFTKLILTPIENE